MQRAPWRKWTASCFASKTWTPQLASTKRPWASDVSGVRIEDETTSLRLREKFLHKPAQLRGLPGPRFSDENGVARHGRAGDLDEVVRGLSPRAYPFREPIPRLPFIRNPPSQGKGSILR